MNVQMIFGVTAILLCGCYEGPLEPVALDSLPYPHTRPDEPGTPLRRPRGDRRHRRLAKNDRSAQISEPDADEANALPAMETDDTVLPLARRR